MTESGDSRVMNVKNKPTYILPMNKLNKITVLKPGMKSMFLQNIKTIGPLYKDEIIYQSVNGDFLNLSDSQLTLINRLNTVTKSVQTIARFEKNGQLNEEKTSEEITDLIGKENYDLLFTTLCSVISQELKVRGILALLTVPHKKFGQNLNRASENTPDNSRTAKTFVNTFVQTEDSSFDIMMRTKPKKRVRRQHPSPYVVTDKPEPTKVVINPKDFKAFTSQRIDEMVALLKFDTSVECLKEENSPKVIINPASTTNTLPETDDLPVLHIEEDSRDSFGGHSQISISTTSDMFLKDPYSVIKNIDKVTEKETVDWSNPTTICLLDGTEVKVPMKIEDEFHIASPKVLKFVPKDLWRKLLLYQLYVDWKNCLRRDEDSHLPIHHAVLNDDVDLVRRQCLVLKSREESVDIPIEDDTSALQLSILGGTPRCTATLLQHGADPLHTDSEYRTCFHLAAEAQAGHLQALVAHCRTNTLQVLHQSDVWKPELALKPKEYQESRLFDSVCSTFDVQGYTPLMLAAKLGLHENVKTLVEISPSNINKVMPTAGNTALHLAVESACHDSLSRGNKSKISDNFKKTINILVDNGADPAIANSSDVDVNTLLADFGNNELSKLVASILTYRNTESRSDEPLVLIKHEDGTMEALNVNPNERRGRPRKNKEVKVIVNTNAMKDKQIEPEEIISTIGLETQNIKIISKNTNVVPKIEKTQNDKQVVKSAFVINSDNSKSPFLNSYVNFVEVANAANIIIEERLQNKLKRRSRSRGSDVIDHPRVKTLKKLPIKEINVPKLQAKLHEFEANSSLHSNFPLKIEKFESVPDNSASSSSKMV